MRTLHLWSPPLEGLQAGHSLQLSPEEHHHFSRVLRGKVGHEVVLMDGLGSTANATCHDVSKKESHFTLTSDSLAHPRGPKIKVYGPIPKGKRFPYLMEKLQELGISSYGPLQTEHSVREEWSAEARRRTSERLIDACKQSRCPYLMVLEDSKTIDELNDSAPPLVLDVNSPPLLSTQVSQSSVLIFGPEAGWSDQEKVGFESKGWKRVGLNGQHLRMETAAILGAGTLLQMKVIN